MTGHGFVVATLIASIAEVALIRFFPRFYCRRGIRAWTDRRTLETGCIPEISGPTDGTRVSYAELVAIGPNEFVVREDPLKVFLSLPLVVRAKAIFEPDHKTFAIVAYFNLWPVLGLIAAFAQPGWGVGVVISLVLMLGLLQQSHLHARMVQVVTRCPPPGESARTRLRHRSTDVSP